MEWHQLLPPYCSLHIDIFKWVYTRIHGQIVSKIKQSCQLKAKFWPNVLTLEGLGPKLKKMKWSLCGITFLLNLCESNSLQSSKVRLYWRKTCLLKSKRSMRAWERGKLACLWLHNYRLRVLETDPIATMEASTSTRKSFSHYGGIRIGDATNFHFKVLNALVQVVVHTWGIFVFFSNSIRGMAIVAYLKMNLQ